MKAPPQPSCSQYALAIFNLAIFLVSACMLVGGAMSLAGYSSQLQDDLQQLSSSLSEYITPEMAQELTDTINYAPTILVVFGSLLLFISFTGCCGAFSKSRCLLGGYAFMVTVLLLSQLVIVIYALVKSGSIQNAAGELTESLWDKRCRCFDGPTCQESATQCLHPDMPAPCPEGADPASCFVKCQPCREYLESSVCGTPELATAATCAAHVRGLVQDNLRALAGILAASVLLQVACLVAAIRTLRWLRQLDRALRAEEALLAETYLIYRGIPYGGPGT